MEPIAFWKDEAKTAVDPKLFSGIADQMAEEIKNEFLQSGKKLNRRTQIRKFYDEIIRLDVEAAKINIATEPGKQRWNDILPIVHMLTAKAAYANGRKLVSENFMKFIKASVEQIETPKDLKIFSTFFEAFMGFYKYHVPEN